MSNLQNNTTGLQAILAAVNALPEAGETLPDLIADEPETMGQRACLARVAQMRDIVYTPVADLPHNYGSWPAGEPVQGLTYSSVRQTDKFIGYNVSLHTFMTALHNPKSVLYTKTATGAIAKTWYGLNCSVFVSYAHDWDYHSATDVIPYLEYIKEFDDPADIQLCDIPNCAKSLGGAEGHTVLVTGIMRNADGSIDTIEITEANSMKMGTKTMTFDEFVAYYITERKYKLYRDSRLYKAAYKASDYVKVFPEEPTVEIVYSDLCTDLGDKATIHCTETITLNPLVTDGYTAIKLYKNGAEIAEYTVGDIELSNLEAGHYSATLYPEKEHCSTSWIVADVKATVDGNRYYFSGVGGIPIRAVFKDIDGYTLAVTNFTEDDIARGYKDIEYSNDALAQVCIPFRNEYGFVVVKAVKASGNLPDEYQELAYIATSGNQYIDTGIFASDHAAGMRYVFKGVVTEKSSTTQTDYYWGATNGSSRSGYVGVVNPANNAGGTLALYAGSNGNNIKTTTFVFDTDITLDVTASATKATSATAKLNGVDFNAGSGSAANASAEPNASIWLFACNGISDTSGNRRFYGKCYSFTMAAADGTAIRNFVPCYRKSDSVVGMYDTVSGAFFTNAGTGTFTAGPEV